MDITQVKKELFKLDARPKKNLGQHFLLDDSIVERMVKEAHINQADTIFEIGPGLGILTRQLTKSPAKKIIVCEKDRIFFNYLQSQVKQKNLSIINQDALVVIPKLNATPPLKVISNLPYNISSPVIISLLTVCPVLPEIIILMIQKEVAQRLTANPGDSNRGILTVFIELFAKVKIIEKLTPSRFYPPPQVESAVVEISNITMPDLDRKRAFRIIKMAFANKRKKLKNSLFSTMQISSQRMKAICESASITPDLRPEDLNITQWKKIIEELEK